MEEIHNLVRRIAKISNPKNGGKKDIIGNLIEIEKDLIKKNTLKKENDKRIDKILKVMLALAKLNYNEKALITGKLDHIDAVASGINMLGEELKTSTVSLQEKEVLLKEVHHRVKNNLQIISSLLRLQAKSIRDKNSLEKFEETQNRVRAMALVHEKLYESKESSRIDFIEYIHDFIEAVNRSYNISDGRISLNLNMEACDVNNRQLKIDIAVPCALILNELVSNCFKHAFPNNRKGNIYLDLGRSKHNECIIKVADNGIGVKEGMNLEATSSLGLQLVAMLVEQIGGEMIILSQEGTTFIIKFKTD